MKNTGKISNYLLLIATVFFVAAAWNYHNFTDPVRQTQKFQKELSRRFNRFLEKEPEVLEMIEKQNPGFLFQQPHFTDELKSNNYSLFIYQNGIPVFWTDNITIPKKNNTEKGLVELNNGWYIRDYKRLDDYTVIWLLGISNEFPVQNKYLEPRFLIDTGLPPGVKISRVEKKGSYPVKLAYDTVFYLDFSNSNPGKSVESAFLVIAFFLWFIALLIRLYQSWLQFDSFGRKWKSATAGIVVLTVFRLIWLNNPFPSALYENRLFDPSVYAQSAVFPSLGDLLINALMILFFSFIAEHLLKIRQKLSGSDKAAVLWIIFLLLNILFVSGINNLLEGLIRNSRISFNLEHLFELDTFSLVGMLAVGLLYMSYYVLIASFIRKVHQTGLSFSIFVLSATIVYALLMAVQMGRSIFSPVDVFWSLGIIITIGYWTWHSDRVFNFGISLFNIAIFALFTAYAFEKYNAEKEHRIREVIAERINSIQDPVLEIDFEEKIKKLNDNRWIKEIFDKGKADPQDINALKVYFGDRWYRFDKLVSLSGKDRQPLPGSPVLKAIKIDSLTPTITSDLYFFYGDSIGPGYLFSVPLLFNKDTLGYLSGIFSEIPETVRPGFPELLENPNPVFSHLDDYLFARYRDNHRIYSNDEDLFPPEYAQIGNGKEKGGFVQRMGYDMLILPEQYDNRWIIAKPLPGFIQHLTIFSYLFLFLGFLYALWLMFERLFREPQPFRLSLRAKVQLILIGFIFGILTIYALIVFAQITEQFHRQNTEQIRERLKSVGIELQHKTGHLNDLNKMPGVVLKSYLDKFSEVFYSDITVFNNRGILRASSTNMIWDKNLLSNRINPSAYKAVNIEKKSRFIQEESIGSFEYLSGYQPLYNESGMKLGILNIPYFARQDKLRKEINRFLLILINVFVLLTGISIIIAIYVSSRITAPLKMLQDSFTGLDLTNVNQPVPYSGNDEISAMVKVYNRKVRELEEMANRMARSERESAWREMARQVAHEIKNPLTPMRLSIQHFERTLKENPEEAMKGSENLVHSLIAQIDNLTQIANEFSQFARISVSSVSEFDLKEQMLKIAGLFSSNEQITVQLETRMAKAPLKADKGQIIRMLNNLLQNAVQAIGTKKDGKIIIRLEKTENGRAYKIDIEDNGKGIPPDVQSRIFKPNFTTKSTGMGLGLAIVKKIVSNHKGTITYKTGKNKGTVFTVILPLEQ